MWILSLFVWTVTLSGMAKAQSLRDYMFGGHSPEEHRGELPDVALFKSNMGKEFVFDNSQGRPLVRFDNSDEVFALSATRGTKGDVIFKNDIGEPVLKATRWGGLILFNDDNPGGDAVSIEGKARSIVSQHLSPAQLFQSLVHASSRASKAAMRLIEFNASDVSPQSDYIYADAANITADAMSEIAKRNNGQKLLEPIKSVAMIEGRPPSVTIKSGVLLLKIDSTASYAGRPSSKKVMLTITLGH